MANVSDSQRLQRHEIQAFNKCNAALSRAQNMLIRFDIPSRDRVIRDDDDDDDAAVPSARRPRRVCIILWRVNNIL